MSWISWTRTAFHSMLNAVETLIPYFSQWGCLRVSDLIPDQIWLNTSIVTRSRIQFLRNLYMIVLTKFTSDFDQQCGRHYDDKDRCGTEYPVAFWVDMYHFSISRLNGYWILHPDLVVIEYSFMPKLGYLLSQARFCLTDDSRSTNFGLNLFKPWYQSEGNYEYTLSFSPAIITGCYNIACYKTAWFGQ